jgi:hypothetical protein
MNNNTDKFRLVVRKYRLTNDIPLHAQETALASARTNLTVILKKTRNYSVIFGAVIYIFSVVRKFGFRLTLAQCKVVLAISTAIVLTIITGGAYMVISELSLPLHYDKPAEHMIDKPEIKPSTSVTALDVRKSREASIARFDLGVHPFSGEDAETAAAVTLKITGRLKELLGDKNVIPTRARGKEKVTRAIMGSVRWLIEDQYITVKIINMANSRVEFATSEKVDPKGDIDGACSRISSIIADKIGTHEKN